MHVWCSPTLNVVRLLRGWETLLPRCEGVNALKINPLITHFTAFRYELFLVTLTQEQLLLLSATLQSTTKDGSVHWSVFKSPTGLQLENQSIFENVSIRHKANQIKSAEKSQWGFLPESILDCCLLKKCQATRDMFFFFLSSPLRDEGPAHGSICFGWLSHTAAGRMLRRAMYRLWPGQQDSGKNKDGCGRWRVCGVNSKWVGHLLQRSTKYPSPIDSRLTLPLTRFSDPL